MSPLTIHWYRLQSQRIQRGTFDSHFRNLHSRILDALHRGSLCDESKTAETGQRLSNECFSLFVLVHYEGVSPTNDAAERALRKAVIFRTLSFDTEKKTGSKNLSVTLFVMETCRRLNRSRLDFIRKSIHAALSNKITPNCSLHSNLAVNGHEKSFIPKAVALPSRSSRR